MKALAILLLAGCGAAEIHVVGTVPLREPSGLAASRLYPGVFWTVNDSGNPPVLYAIGRDGSLRAEFPVHGAPNIDWESVALGEEGRLTIGDVGNNLGALPRRWIYTFREPDPARPGPIEPEARTSYTFPGRPFDVEAMIVRDGQVLLINKGSPTKLYAVGTPLRELRELPGIPPVTGADLSPDGRLAVCGYDFAAVFDWEHWRIVRFEWAPVESCAFDGETLLLLAEDGRLFAWDPP